MEPLSDSKFYKSILCAQNIIYIIIFIISMVSPIKSLPVVLDVVEALLVVVLSSPCSSVELIDALDFLTGPDGDPSPLPSEPRGDAAVASDAVVSFFDCGDRTTCPGTGCT